jgi:hypothetical protein
MLAHLMLRGCVGHHHVGLWSHGLMWLLRVLRVLRVLRMLLLLLRMLCVWRRRGRLPLHRRVLRLLRGAVVHGLLM